MLLVIDFRMHEASGIGTYIKNLLPFLINKFDIVLLGKGDGIKKYFWGDKVKIIECNSKIYSIKEQLELCLKIPKCDIFWSPHYNVPLLPIKSRYRVVTIHDVFHFAFYNSLSIMQKIYAKIVLNSAIKKSDILLSVSEFSKNEIIKYTNTKKKIEVIGNAIDYHKFHYFNNKIKLNSIVQKYKLPKKFALFVGNVKPHKNLKNLLIAIIDCDIDLVAVGKKDGFITKDNMIFDLIRKYNLDDRVVFTGYANDDDVPLIYNLATLFVFPSTYEGFGIPPLEAQACGCPVVCSNVASLPEVCGDSVVYCDPYNVDDIRKKIQMVINDEKLQNKIHQKGFENIKRFSWERSAQQIIEILERLK